jgi:putative ABC transport system permease protein
VTLRETFRSALLGLSANLLRSLLTVLGILIGVAAVITLVAVGNGSSAQVQARIRSLGTNTLTVFNTGRLANGGAAGRFRAFGAGGGFGGGGFGGGGFGGGGLGGGGGGGGRLATGASGTSSTGTQIRAVTLGSSDVAAP